MFDVISSIVISLSRCCLPNDERPGPLPKYFFLEPPLISTEFCSTIKTRRCSSSAAHRGQSLPSTTATDLEQAAGEVESVLVEYEQVLDVVSRYDQGIQDERIGRRTEDTHRDHGALEIKART